MVRNVKLRKMGGSVGATLPKDLADRFHFEAGDEVLVVETAHGILLTPYDPDVEDGLAVAAEAQKRYRKALRELAK
jgi:putative addiction module antidote